MAAKSPIENTMPIRTSPTNSHTWMILIGLFTAVLIALGVRQQGRIKQRRALLSELSEWLIEHE